MLTPEARGRRCACSWSTSSRRSSASRCKPMENIEGIKILHVDGLGGGGGGEAAMAPARRRLRRQRGQLGAALSGPRRRWSTSCCARSASTPATSGRPHWRCRPASRPPADDAASRRAAVRDQGLHVERHRRAGRRGLGARSATSTACRSGTRRSPTVADRGQLAVRPRRLHPQFPRCATAARSASSCSRCPTTTISAPTRSSRARWASRTTSPP